MVTFEIQSILSMAVVYEDSLTMILVSIVVCRLDVSRGTYSNLNSTVEVECVVEVVVVIAD